MKYELQGAGLSHSALMRHKQRTRDSITRGGNHSSIIQLEKQIVVAGLSYPTPPSPKPSKRFMPDAEVCDYVAMAQVSSIRIFSQEIAQQIILSTSSVY